MKKSVLLTIVMILMFSMKSFAVEDTIWGNISDANGYILNGITVQAINNSTGKLIVETITFSSKGYWTAVPAGYNIKLVPVNVNLEYDYSPQKIIIPTINRNMKGQSFTAYDKVNLLAPTVISPLKGSTVSAKPTFVWNKLNCPTYYCIIISSSATMKDTIYKKDSIPATDTTFTVPTPLKANSSNTYYFQILSVSYPVEFGSTRHFAASVISNFKTIPTITMVEPSKIAINASIINNYSNTLNYSITKSCFVSIFYYNLQGKIIGKFVDKIQNIGNYSINLPIIGYSKGTYLQVFKAGDYTKNDVIKFY